MVTVKNTRSRRHGRRCENGRTMLVAFSGWRRWLSSAPGTIPTERGEVILAALQSIAQYEGSADVNTSPHWSGSSIGGTPLD